MIDRAEVEAICIRELTPAEQVPPPPVEPPKPKETVERPC